MNSFSFRLRNPLPRTPVVALCLVVFLCHGCAGVRKSLGEIAVVQVEIAKKFSEDVSVNQRHFNNSTTIVVTFVNSALNDYGEDARASRAHETAKLVKASHPSIARIDSITINFLRQQTRYLVITYTQLLSSFEFDRDAKPLPTQGNQALFESNLTPRANYSTSQQRTEVSVEIRLEGMAGAGITMIPHFSVAGDANKQPSEPPDVVTFDFASYSPQRKFPGETNITIQVDNKPIYEKGGWFSASRAGDGQVAEFLYLPVPYDKFREISSGNDVTIKLGTHKYALDHNQLIALKNMNAYVQQPLND